MSTNPVYTPYPLPYSAFTEKETPPASLNGFIDRLASSIFKVKEGSSMVSEHEKGNSGHTIHYVWLKDTVSPSFVIKQFGGYASKKMNRLFHTKAALEIMNQHTFKNLTHPKIIKWGPSNESPHLGYMATTYLEGTGFTSKLESFSHTTISSYSRQLLLIKLCSDYKMAGKCLAELHNTKILKGKSEPFISILAHLIEPRKEYVLRILEKAHITLSTTAIDINQLAEDAKKNPGSSTYVHGDAYLNNFILGEKIGLIDFDNMIYSIGENLDPIGIPTMDREQFLFSIEVYGYYFKLEAQEISALKEAFLNEYTETFKGEHTEEAKRFFRLYWLYYALSKPKSDIKWVADIINQEYPD
ncbi:aminoglycoside phosphotransferase family protein [Chlamydiales bacterium]|nr:aminoglycoside phosphotransferase family protein [Chlamydiales bacterium]